MRTRFIPVLALALAGCQGSDIEIFAAAAAAGRGGGGGTGSGGSDMGGAGIAEGTAGAAGTTGGASGAGAVTSGGGPNGGAGGVAGGGEMPCTSNDECPAAWLCKKVACGDPLGHCEVRPVFCDDNFMPVCGCDHVTYWNECYRRRAGQAASSADDCTAGAHSCFNDADCAEGAYCQHLLPRGISCDQMVGAGTCWVTPDICPDAPDQMRWKPCTLPGSDAGAAGLGGCVSTCVAVQSGRPYVPVSSSGSCQ